MAARSRAGYPVVLVADSVVEAPPKSRIARGEVLAATADSVADSAVGSKVAAAVASVAGMEAGEVFAVALMTIPGMHPPGPALAGVADTAIVAGMTEAAAHTMIGPAADIAIGSVIATGTAVDVREATWSPFDPEVKVGIVTGTEIETAIATVIVIVTETVAEIVAEIMTALAMTTAGNEDMRAATRTPESCDGTKQGYRPLRALWWVSSSALILCSLLVAFRFANRG